MPGKKIRIEEKGKKEGKKKKLKKRDTSTVLGDFRGKVKLPQKSASADVRDSHRNHNADANKKIFFFLSLFFSIFFFDKVDCNPVV